MDAGLACRALGGIARTQQLRNRGVSRRDLAASVRSGVLTRIREGLYAHVDTATPVVHALRHGGRLACISALEHHGLWVLHDVRLHIALTRDGHTYPHPGCGAAVVGHWDDTEGGLAAVPVPAALDQVARCGSEEQFFVTLESALNRRLLSTTELPALRASVPAIRRPVLDLAGPQAESGLESLVRWRLHLRGVVCRSQAFIPGVGRVDLLIGDRLVVELDGREHHAPEVAFEVDRRRDAAAAALGFHTLRFTYWQVLHDWSGVEGAVMAVVDQGLHETAAGRRYREASRVRVRGVPPRHAG